MPSARVSRATMRQEDAMKASRGRVRKWGFLPVLLLGGIAVGTNDESRRLAAGNLRKARRHPPSPAMRKAIT